MNFKAILVVATVSLGFLGCKNTEQKKETTTPQIEEIQVVEKEDVLDERYLIQGNSFMGIRPLDPIELHSNLLQRGKIKVDEVVKEVLVLEIDGEEVGYATPNREDKRMVGSSTFQSPKIITDKGIKVGATFGEVLKKYANLELRTTKNGKKIYAKSESIAFLLDLDAKGKAVTIEAIPEATKVIEIKLVNNKISNN